MGSGESCLVGLGIWEKYPEAGRLTVQPTSLRAQDSTVVVPDKHWLSVYPHCLLGLGQTSAINHTSHEAS